MADAIPIFPFHSMMKNPLDKRFSIPILGIAGGSGSGKTAIVDAFLQYSRIPITLIALDWYYRDLSALAFEERRHTNFDCPDAIETELLVSHLLRLSSGKPIDAPIYDFSTHTRNGAHSVHPGELIIIDGVLVLAISAVDSLLTRRVYVDTPDDIRLLRRIRRDVAERGRTLESIAEQYVTSVRPMHERFVLPSKGQADLLLNGMAPLPESVNRLDVFIREQIFGQRNESVEF
jgi:uridine kinase